MKYTDYKRINTEDLSDIGFWFLVGVMAVLMASLLMLGIVYTLTL